MASDLGLAQGDLPRRQDFGTWRRCPEPCEWSWQETKPLGAHRTSYGVTVFEGAYPSAGERIVPRWGGSLCEALRPALFVPAERGGLGAGPSTTR